MKLNNDHWIITIALVSTLITGCSVNRVTSNMVSGVRFRPLKNTTLVRVVYTPETTLDYTENSEFFYTLSDDEGVNYAGLLVNQLEEYKIQIHDDSTRFTLNIYDVLYSETNSYECEYDTTNDEEYCFWLNDLNITISMEIFDSQTNETRYFNSHVTETTSIRPRWIGSGFTETGGFLNSPEHLDKMMESCLKKCAGKAGKYIRKQTEITP